MHLAVSSLGCGTPNEGIVGARWLGFADVHLIGLWVAALVVKPIAVTRLAAGGRFAVAESLMLLSFELQICCADTVLWRLTKLRDGEST